MKKLTLALLSLALSACVINPPRPAVQQVKYDLKINESSRDELFVEDVGISLKPISLERAEKMENLYSSYKYWNPSKPNERGIARKIMVNLPAFEVQVTNTSGQSVSFQKAAIRLVDDAGNSYQAQLKQDVVDFAEQQLSDVQSRGWALDRSAAIGSARALRLFDKNYESLPGIIEKRVLTFDIANATNEKAYQQMMKNTKYMRVMMYNVPVKFDQAGNVTKVAKFEYIFDIVKK